MPPITPIQQLQQNNNHNGAPPVTIHITTNSSPKIIIMTERMKQITTKITISRITTTNIRMVIRIRRVKRIGSTIKTSTSNMKISNRISRKRHSPNPNLVLLSTSSSNWMEFFLT